MKPPPGFPPHLLFPTQNIETAQKSNKQAFQITFQFKQTGNLTVMRGESQAFNNYNIKIIIKKKAYK